MNEVSIHLFLCAQNSSRLFHVNRASLGCFWAMLTKMISSFLTFSNSVHHSLPWVFSLLPSCTCTSPLWFYTWFLLLHVKPDLNVASCWDTTLNCCNSLYLDNHFQKYFESLDFSLSKNVFLSALFYFSLLLSVLLFLMTCFSSGDLFSASVWLLLLLNPVISRYAMNGHVLPGLYLHWQVVLCFQA